MRLVLQRVSSAKVQSDNLVSKIGKGLVALVAISDNDNEKDIEFAAKKTASLRIFSNNEGKMDLSVYDIKGEVLSIPQFTLYGDCRKGRRPDFTESAGKKKARDYFELYTDKIKQEKVKVKTGFFGASMKLKLVNDGPVTIIVDTNKRK